MSDPVMDAKSVGMTWGRLLENLLSARQQISAAIIIARDVLPNDQLARLQALHAEAVAVENAAWVRQQKDLKGPNCLAAEYDDVTPTRP